MHHIFCIIGKSSTGKDTIFKRLLEREDLGLMNIISYTTRPIRENETEGIEYFFTDEMAEEAFEKEGKLIEKRSYNTFHGKWDYFTVDDGQVDLLAYNYLIIATLVSYQKLAGYYGKDVCIPIYIEVEDGIRLDRALLREHQQTEPKYEEMCRRFLADNRDFSEEKLTKAGVTMRFYNHRVDTTVEEIAEYIKEKCNLPAQA